MEELKKYRKQIDSVDKQILKLIKKRMVIVKKIGVWKKKKEFHPLDKKRWQEVLKSRISQGINLKLNPDFIKKIYTLIHNESLKEEEL